MTRSHHRRSICMAIALAATGILFVAPVAGQHSGGHGGGGHSGGGHGGAGHGGGGGRGGSGGGGGGLGGHGDGAPYRPDARLTFSVPAGRVARLNLTLEPNGKKPTVQMMILPADKKSRPVQLGRFNASVSATTRPLALKPGVYHLDLNGAQYSYNITVETADIEDVKKARKSKEEPAFTPGAHIQGKI